MNSTGGDKFELIHKIENQLQCLRRLFASKSGYQAFTSVNGYGGNLAYSVQSPSHHCAVFRVREKLGTLVQTVLNKNNEAIDNATVEMLCALLQPMHANFELRFEQLNKQSMLASRPFDVHLIQLMVKHIVSFMHFCIILPNSSNSNSRRREPVR